jgi:Icc protein
MLRSRLFCLLPLLVACLDVAEERARADLEVGHATVEKTRVDVENGFAAVRRFEPGTLELWGNAPTLHLELRTAADAPRQWSLAVRNVMPNAVISAHTADGVALAVASEPMTFSTERRIFFGVAPGSTVSVDIGPADAERSTPFEFLEFADVQEAVDRVGDIFAKMNRESAARFVVMAGDITQRGEVAQLEHFQARQSELNVPIFVTLGNHELGTSDGAPYRAHFGRGSQSFTFHGVRFTLLDDASASIDPLVYSWLDDWLLRGQNGVHLLFMHIPPLDPIGIRDGAFSSRAEAAKFIARLGRGGVDMTFYGHIHSYYEFENGGIPAFICGGGGAIPERFDGIGRHFLAVSVDPASQRVDTRLVRVDD